MALRRSSNTNTLASVMRHVYKYDVDYVRPKVVNSNRNPYIQYCTNLKNITFVLAQMFDIDMTYKTEKGLGWIKEIYSLLPDYVGRDIENDEDEIELITRISDLLLRYNMYEAYEALILNSGDSFLISYINIQKNPQIIFHHLKQIGLQNVCDYLWNYLYIDNALDYSM